MTGYICYFAVGLIVNAIKINSPKFEALLEKTITDFRKDYPEKAAEISPNAANFIGYGAAALGAVVGAATISLPVMIGKALFQMYEVKKDNDDDDTPTATAPA